MIRRVDPGGYLNHYYVLLIDGGYIHVSHYLRFARIRDGIGDRILDREQPVIRNADCDTVVVHTEQDSATDAVAESDDCFEECLVIVRNCASEFQFPGFATSDFPCQLCSDVPHGDATQ